MQCIYCWVPVKERPTGGGKTWGRGEEEDTKRWVHDGTRNSSGNQACNRQFLADEEVEPIETDSDTEAEV